MPKYTPRPPLICFGHLLIMIAGFGGLLIVCPNPRGLWFDSCFAGFMACVAVLALSFFGDKPPPGKDANKRGTADEDHPNKKADLA